MVYDQGLERALQKSPKSQSVISAILRIWWG